MLLWGALVFFLLVEVMQQIFPFQYKYIGCYKKPSVHNISLQYKKPPVDAEGCLLLCYNKQHRYGALYFSMCVCSNVTLSKDDKAWTKDRECDNVCPCNSADSCGGKGKISIYEILNETIISTTLTSGNIANNSHTNSSSWPKVLGIRTRSIGSTCAATTIAINNLTHVNTMKIVNGSLTTNMNFDTTGTSKPVGTSFIKEAKEKSTIIPSSANLETTDTSNPVSSLFTKEAKSTYVTYSMNLDTTETSKQVNTLFTKNAKDDFTIISSITHADTTDNSNPVFTIEATEKSSYNPHSKQLNITDKSISVGSLFTKNPKEGPFSIQHATDLDNTDSSNTISTFFKREAKVEFSNIPSTNLDTTTASNIIATLFTRESKNGFTKDPAYTKSDRTDKSTHVDPSFIKEAKNESSTIPSSTNLDATETSNKISTVRGEYTEDPFLKNRHVTTKTSSITNPNKNVLSNNLMSIGTIVHAFRNNKTTYIRSSGHMNETTSISTIPASERYTTPTNSSIHVLVAPSRNMNLGNYNCFCPCNSTSKWSTIINQNKSQDEISSLINDKVYKLREKLKINKKLTSFYIRQRTCAQDNRKSSATIGLVGIAIIILVPSLFILIDLTLFFQ